MNAYHPNPGRNGCLLVIAIIVGLALLLAYNLSVGAEEIGPKDRPLTREESGRSKDVTCYPYPNGANFCLYWGRFTENQAAPVIELIGRYPDGHAILTGTPNGEGNPYTWAVTEQSGNRYPFPEIVDWAIQMLNAPIGDEESVHFPLLWREDIRLPFTEWIYFTKLHVIGKFYFGWSLEDGIQSEHVWIEGSWPNGGGYVRKMQMGNGCFWWVADFTGNPKPEYQLVMRYTAAFLNDNLEYTPEIEDQMRDLVPAQIDDYNTFLSWVISQFGYPGECTPEEPPVMPYRMFVPMAVTANSNP